MSSCVRIEPDGEEPVLDWLHSLDLLDVVALLHGPAVAGGLAEHPVQGHRGVGRPRGRHGRRDEVQQGRHVPFPTGLRSLGPPTEREGENINIGRSVCGLCTVLVLPRQWRLFTEFELGEKL